MSNRTKIVERNTVPCNNEQDEWRTKQPTSGMIRRRVHEEIDRIFERVYEEDSGKHFGELLRSIEVSPSLSRWQARRWASTPRHT